MPLPPVSIPQPTSSLGVLASCSIPGAKLRVLLPPCFCSLPGVFACLYYTSEALEAQPKCHHLRDMPAGASPAQATGDFSLPFWLLLWPKVGGASPSGGLAKTSAHQVAWQGTGDTREWHPGSTGMPAVTAPQGGSDSVVSKQSKPWGPSLHLLKLQRWGLQSFFFFFNSFPRHRARTLTATGSLSRCLQWLG